CEYPGLSFQRSPVCACSLVSSLLLSGATMSQQSSLTQSVHSVRQVLTAYTLQWSVPALSMAARFVAVSLFCRIHIARWYRVDNPRVGLHRRCTDRGSDRPCDVRAERKPSARNQVQLRWF